MYICVYKICILYITFLCVSGVGAIIQVFWLVFVQIELRAYIKTFVEIRWCYCLRIKTFARLRPVIWSCPALVLIYIINKGSMPDSCSTTYHKGVSLSDILSSFVLEKYIVCDVCGLRSPSFESSSVLYITPNYTSSMQDLILQGMQQKWHKYCSRCNKNTWHVEPNYILQPPKYSLLTVNRFRYTNNNVTKERCSIPMDMTVVFGPLKFSLRTTVNRHGPSIHPG